MRARRTDRNHTEVVRLAERCGLKVHDTSRLGDGFPDLCVAYGGLVELWEVKDGTKPPSRRKLKPSQEKFKAKGFPVRLIQSAEDVLQAVKTIRKDLEVINKSRMP